MSKSHFVKDKQPASSLVIIDRYSKPPASTDPPTFPSGTPLLRSVDRGDVEHRLRENFLQRIGLERRFYWGLGTENVCCRCSLLVSVNFM